MQIIFGREIADQLKEKYVVLELETHQVKDQEITTFCVVPSEKIPLVEMADIERYKRLHQCVADTLRQGRYGTTLEAISHVRGKFGGEVDSFYSVIEERLTKGSLNDGTV